MITTSEPDIKTNIIYFTSRCNLACTYCYEHLKDAEKNTISREDLVSLADNTFKREPDDEQTFFILFGGEATMQWDNVEFFMDYAYSKKENIRFNLISNGIRFLDDDFTNRFINNSHYRNGRLSIDISFDGMKGNSDRIYHNGKSSTEDMLQILSKLKLIAIQYRLRYTIHSSNIDVFVGDILKLIKYFSPARVVLGEVTEDLSPGQLKMLQAGKDKLLSLWNNQELQVPICTKYNEFCDTCNGCSINRDNLSLYTSNKEVQRPLVSEGLFDDFKYNK